MVETLQTYYRLISRLRFKEVMRKIFILFGFTFCVFGADFGRFDVAVFPEYYFPGVMVEIKAEPVSGETSPAFRLTVPSGTDSAFFKVAGESEPVSLNVILSGNQKFIEVPSSSDPFRLFYFYPVTRFGESVSFSYELNVDQTVKNVHIMIQEPIVAQNFTLSETGAEFFQDAHGLSFHRIHVATVEAGILQEIMIQYKNPSGQTTIDALRGLLSTDQPDMSGHAPVLSNQVIQRHTLPSWQPLTVLGFLAVIVGWMFYNQRKKEDENEHQHFCRSCGSKVKESDKYCVQCGREL